MDREYRIQAPDGTTLRIVGPADATPEQLRAAAERAFASRQQAPQTAETSAEIPGAGPGMTAPPTEPEAPGFFGRLARDIPAGAVAGTATMPATATMLGGKTAEESQQLKKEIEAGLQSLTGADPTSPFYKGAKFITEVLGTAGLGPLLGRALTTATASTRAAPFVAPTAAAIETGGMGATGAGGVTGASGMGVRAAGGAVGGAAGAVATEGTPEAAATGGAVGAALPPVVRGLSPVVGSLYRGVVEPLISPAAATQRTLLADIGGPSAAPDVLEQIRRGAQVPTTPGFQRTLPETLLAGGATQPQQALAVRTQQIGETSPRIAQAVFERSNERIGALNAQLQRINDRITQQGAVLTPASMDELINVRDGILRSLDAERQTVEQASRTVGQMLPVGTMQFGQRILNRARELNEAFKRTEVDPRYNTALNLGGDVPNIDATGIIQAVEGIYERPLSTFSPTTAPRIASILNRLNAQRGDEPALTTLRIMHDLRKAINAEASAAARSQNYDRAYNLGQLQSSVDDAIRNAPNLADDAKNAYREATAFYRDVYGPMFRDRETGKILGRGTFGEMRIDTDKIVDAFTANETAATQFVRTFSGDPAAYTALRDGISEKFARAAIDGRTGLIDPGAARKFMEDNRAVFNILENNGVGVRQGLEKVEAQAGQTADLLNTIRSFNTRFEGKGKESLFKELTEDPQLMRFAMNRSDSAGQDTIRRVLVQRVNTLIDTDPQKALRELSKDGRIRSSYRIALGNQNVTDLRDRAQLATAVRNVQADPVLKNPNAVPGWFRAQDFTPEQLTALQPVVDDLRRLNQIQNAAVSGRTVEGLRPRQILDQAVEQGPEGAAASFKPQRINFMTTTASVIRNLFSSIENVIKYKVNAELATILYNNPEAAAKAIESALASSRRAARPSVMGAPVAAGAGIIGAQSQQRPEELPQE